MSEIPLEITAQDVHHLIQAPEPLLLIDVREPGEYALARIEGAELIPMRTIPQRLTHLQDREEPLIVICHHGVRSQQVAAWLREHGVENAQSMSGGMDAWSQHIDPSIPRY